MSSGVRRAVIAVAGVAVLVVAFLLLSGGGERAAPSTSTTSSTHQSATKPDAACDRPRRGRQAAGRRRRSSPSSKGDTVRFSVVSDTADEIHVHGYDVHKDVAKGGVGHVRLPGQDRGPLRRRARGQAASRSPSSRSTP